MNKIKKITAVLLMIPVVIVYRLMIIITFILELLILPVMAIIYHLIKEEINSNKKNITFFGFTKNVIEYGEGEIRRL